MRLWSPRRASLVGLLAVAAGLVPLAVLPAQYGSLPVGHSLSMQAVVLYACAVVGAGLVTWAVATAWTGTPRWPVPASRRTEQSGE